MLEERHDEKRDDQQPEKPADTQRADPAVEVEDLDVPEDQANAVTGGDQMDAGSGALVGRRVHTPVTI
jgi:hypothetical protein